MKKYLLLLNLIMLFLFAGCAKQTNEYDRVEEGIITGKSYVASTVTMNLMTVVNGNTVIYQPYNTYYPEQFNISCKVNGNYVYWDNKSIYESCEIGDKVMVTTHYIEYDDGQIYQSKPNFVKVTSKTP